MNILILAAGYATRLYPLTENTAKPLLTVAGKPMIEWVMDAFAPSKDQLETVYIVTNDKFAHDFQQWADGYRAAKAAMDFKIINDGSTSNDDKLGAIGDIHFVVNQENLAENDLIVVAGDNLFNKPLDGFIEAAKGRPAMVGVYDVGDVPSAKKYNNFTTDGEGRITSFVEKPENPTSSLAAIALYYYSRAVVPLFNTYIAEGNNPDQPGRFVEWLFPRDSFYTYQIDGIWFDIGSKETLEEANEVFREFV